MRNLRLTIAYDGTEYHGFQRQLETHGPTIQGVMEQIWLDLTGERISLSVAGRTDKGVHAAGQVVNFHSEMRIPMEKLPKAFNSLLPKDIRVLDATLVPDDFHARRSAQWKRYDYQINNSSIDDVFSRLYAQHEPVPLDVGAMQAGAAMLEGHHNFRAFAAAGGSSKTFERRLYACKVFARGPMIKIICIGDGFLYNMVRIIAGTLLYVGKGRILPQNLPNIISKQDRTKAGKTAAACGLTLAYVHYGEEMPWEIFGEVFENKLL